jgi:hypothetical protein
MKNTIIILAVYVSTIFYAYGSHVIGTDISYKSLNANGLFEVKLIIYRDCSGIKLCMDSCGKPCSVLMSISSDDNSCRGETFGQFNLNLVNVRSVNPFGNCPNYQSICTNMDCLTPGTYTPGIERYEFVGLINLLDSNIIPKYCCNVKLSYSTCCRSSNISTGGANANYYTEAIINKCLSASISNSSPEFRQDPLTVICNSQPVIYNMGASDSDLDSLSYHFVPSLQSTGASINYITPYAYDRPMPWSGPSNGSFPAGISISSRTGDFFFTPNSTANFVGIVAIKVSQWRKNQLTDLYEQVGNTRRDMQIWIKTCEPNNTPRILTSPGLNGNPSMPNMTWVVCANHEICFDIIAKDTDFIVSDTTYLSWDGQLAKLGATFKPKYDSTQRKVNGPREDIYTFCWKPSSSMISSLPYYFTVKSFDNRCPIAGSAMRSFSVKVNPNYPMELKIQNQGCGQYRIFLSSDFQITSPHTVRFELTTIPNDKGFIGPLLYQYSLSGFKQIQFTDTGMYYVRAFIQYPNSFCSSSFIDSFYVTHNGYTSYINDTAFCLLNNASLTLRPTEKNPNQDTISYIWFAKSDSLNILSTSDSLVIKSDSNKYNYVLVTKVGNICMKQNEFKVLDQFPHTITNITGNRNVVSGLYYQYTAVTKEQSCIWHIIGGDIISGQGTNTITALWHENILGKLSCSELKNGCVTTKLLIEVLSTYNSAVSDVESNGKIIIKPNPAKNHIDIQLNNNSLIKLIQMYNIQGMPIKIVNLSSLSTHVELDIQQNQPGCYFLIIEDQNGNRFRSKFVKPN